jgi:O-antigen/teichoic acid export membrane protein
VIVVLAVSVVLAGLLLAIPVIYGAKFEESTTLGFLLLPGVCALGISGVLTANVTGRGRPEYELYTALLSTPVTVVAYLVLIPSMGAVGAALASTGCYVVTLAITYTFFRKVTGLSGLSPFVPTRVELSDWTHLAGDVKRRLVTRG